MAALVDIVDTVTDRDAPINVHDGCTLLPFTLIRLGEYDLYRIRYTIMALLEIEQVFCRSLWTIIEQALIGTLGEEEQTIILHKGLHGLSLQEVQAMLNTLERKEVLQLYKQSQLELTRAMGHVVTYDEHGRPVSMKPRVVDSYKKADVRDTESFEVKKPELKTFGQWYELALNTLFQSGEAMPIEELLSLMPIELEAFFSSHDRRLIYLQKMAIFEAWHAAAFERQERLPDLEPILNRIDRQSNKATESKFTREQAQAIIDKDKSDMEAYERIQREKASKQAKQSEAGEEK